VDSPQLVTVWFPTAADIEQLMVLDNLVYGKNALTKKQWAKLLVRPSALVIALAVKHPYPTAFAVIESHSKYSEILRLVVTPDYQRRGYGSLIVKMLAEYAPIELRLHEDNLNALRFAKKNGFKAIRINKNEFKNGDEIVLWKEQLPPKKN